MLEALAGKKGVTPVDLNAAPLAEGHFNKGMTLAWLLFVQQKWDSLEALAAKEGVKSIDLDAAPLAEKNKYKGNTFSALLTMNIIYIIKTGKLETAKFMLKHWANIRSKDENNNTALHAALVNPAVSPLVEIFFTQLDMNAQNDFQETPLMFAGKAFKKAAEENNQEKIESIAHYYQSYL